ncbi:MAG: AsmA-like C-terminal region-containing protein [Elusimicrobiota bacterium]|jgi:uncharacterized protein involved in outer membrane biogenesis
MKKLLVVSLGAAAVLALLTGAGLLVLRRALPPEKLRALAVEKASAALGREVRLAGAAIGLRGAELTGLEVSEVPSFKAGVALKAGTIVLRPRWAPLLLHRRLEVGEVRLSDWSVEVRRRRDGRLNLQDGKPAAASAAGAKSPSAAASFYVGALRLERGSVRYADESSGLKAAFKDVRLKADGVRLEGAFPLALAFGFDVSSSGKRWTGALDLRGRLDAGGGESARMVLEPDPLVVSLSGLELELRGRAALDRAKLALRLKGDARELAKLSPALAALPLLPLEGSAAAARKGDDLLVESMKLSSGKLLDLSLSGAVRGVSSAKPAPDLSFQLRLDLPALDAKALGLPAAPPPLQAKASGRFDGRVLTLSSLSASAGLLELKASGTVRPDEGPAFDLSAETNEFDLAALAKLVPQAAPYAPAGKARMKLRLAGTKAAPRVSGEARLAGVCVRASGRALSALDGTASAEGDLVRARLKGVVEGSDFELSAQARGFLPPAAKEPELKLEGSFGTLDLGKLLPPKPAGEAAEKKETASARRTPATTLLKTSGKLSVERIKHPNLEAARGELSWNLSGVGDNSRLDGAMRWSVGEGRFEDLRALAAGSPLARAALTPLLALQRISALAKVPLLPSFDRVRFTGAVGDYALKGGVAKVRESRLDADAALATMTGSVDLGRETVDLKINAKPGPAAGMKLSAPVTFTAKGPLADPKVSIDAASVLKQPEVQKAVDQGRRALEDAGQKLLKGLFR